MDVIKTEYACIKFNTFVPMATIQHVIHLSSRIRADGVLCLGPGEHGCLEQAWPPFPPPDQHPGHSPRCYFSLIHICFVFSLLITRQMTTMVKKKKGIMLCSTEEWLLWFLWMRLGGSGLGGNPGPQLSDEHLKDFCALVYKFGEQRRHHRFNVSDWLSRSI